MLRAINSAACKYPGCVRDCRHGSTLQHGQRLIMQYPFNLCCWFLPSPCLPNVLLMLCFCCFSPSSVTVTVKGHSQSCPSSAGSSGPSVGISDSFLNLTVLTTFNKNIYSYISSIFFFFLLFSRTGRNKTKNLGLKWPFKVTKSTSPHLRALVDYTVNAEAVMWMLTFALWRHSTK